MARMCPTQHKQCYVNKGKAIMAAISYSKKRGTPLRVYFHRECKSFHLTHSARHDVDINDNRRTA
jgi:hypothetical protein